jgi:hypothetical protein
MFQVVPHSVTESTAELFCGAFLGDEPPQMATFVLSPAGSSAALELSDADWVTFPGDGLSSIHYARRTVSGLEPGQSYDVELTTSDGCVLAGAHIDTLPAHLPSDGSGSGPHRPLTVWLSSCFYSPKAPAGLTEMVHAVVSDARIRPHLKIFAGDQVYVDYPQKKVLMLSHEGLRQHFNEVYTSSWTQPAFAELLSAGANYFLLDDHEFWDNYPDNPAPILWGLRGASFWEAWKKLALERGQALQSARPSQRIDIGPKGNPELSFFMAQTRLERSRGPYRLLSEESVTALETWLTELSCPGVLVVTQPVVCRGGSPDDTNMQDYRQFRERIRPALQKARSDLVVLAGDPHFGRIAVVDFEDHKMVEVIASPLTLVTPQAGGPAETPPTFPSYGPALERAPVSYPRLAPSYQSAGCTLTEEHAMLLAFFKTEAGVQLRVSLRLARQDSPADEWHWETTLRSHH